MNMKQEHTHMRPTKAGLYLLRSAGSNKVYKHKHMLDNVSTTWVHNYKLLLRRQTQTRPAGLNCASCLSVIGTIMGFAGKKYIQPSVYFR